MSIGRISKLEFVSEEALQEAEITTRKAIEINPNYAQAYFNLGNILREFKKLCSQNNIELIIICLEDYHEIYDFLSENSFNWTTSNLNLNEKDENNKYRPT